MRPHLLVVSAVMCLLQATEATLKQDSEFSNPGTGLKWLRELTSGILQPLSRQKRVIGLPVDSIYEMEWSLNFPFDTYTFYRSKLRLAIPVTIPFSSGIIAAGRKRSVDFDAGQMVAATDSSTHSYSLWPQTSHEDHHERHSRARRAARKERSAIYKRLEDVLHEVGVDGRSCLLRAVCEVAEAPFDQGIVGGMINRVLTASLAGEPNTAEEGREYEVFLEAERLGRQTGRCEEHFPQCKTSPFDLIPYALHSVV
nr:uncharacterized protein LOC123757354 [Procambarus clarkii]